MLKCCICDPGGGGRGEGGTHSNCNFPLRYHLLSLTCLNVSPFPLQKMEPRPSESGITDSGFDKF